MPAIEIDCVDCSGNLVGCYGYSCCTMVCVQNEPPPIIEPSPQPLPWSSERSYGRTRTTWSTGSTRSPDKTGIIGIPRPRGPPAISYILSQLNKRDKLIHAAHSMYKNNFPRIRLNFPNNQFMHILY